MDVIRGRKRGTASFFWLDPNLLQLLLIRIISKEKMSRKNNSVKSGEKQEQNEFVLRSLDRNDVEITALIDLHRSIHAVKTAIVRTCGEETLLDLGEGKLKLAPSSDSLQVADGLDLELPPHESQHLCVDFLLRMKLRRKLMNRLSRRLLRVAHVMDGNDLQPPPVPKYGEQRLHLDPERIKAFSEHLSNREMAIRTIEAARGQIYNKEEKAEKSGESVEEESAPANADSTSPEHVKSADSQEDSPDQPKAKENEIAAPKQAQSASAKDAGQEHDQAATAENSVPEHTLSTTAENGAQGKEETAPDKPQSAIPDAETFTAAARDPLPAEISAEGGSKNENLVVGHTEDVMEACYDMLTDYKDIYEKVVDPATGAVSYPALESERETSLTNTTTGIGATHSSMSVKEKEAEDQKWKAALLSRIPDQPTFGELGLDNRVFNLEGRRKRAMKQKNAEESKRAKLSPDNDSSDEEDMQGDDTDDDKSEAASENEAMDISEEGECKKSVSKTSKGAKNEDNEESDEENDGDEEGEKQSLKEEKDSAKENPSDDSKEKNEVAPVRTKPLSLLPVPSFYDQDLKRVKLIHADLMMSSLQDQARHRLEGVTKDYNNGEQLSSSCIDSVLITFTSHTLLFCSTGQVQ